MSHVFISYSRQDSEYAHKLAAALLEEHFPVWVDDRIDYGETWPRVIQEKLDESIALIVVMTPRSYESQWVQSELARAKRKQKPIFPLLLEGEEPWLSVEATQYANVTGGCLPPADFYGRLAQVFSGPAALYRAQVVADAITARRSKPADDSRTRKTSRVLDALKSLVTRREVWEIGLYEVYRSWGGVEGTTLHLHAKVTDLERLKIYAPKVQQDYVRYLEDTKVQSERHKRRRAQGPAFNDPLEQVVSAASAGVMEEKYLRTLGMSLSWYPTKADLKELPAIATELVEANLKLSLPLDLIGVNQTGNKVPD